MFLFIFVLDPRLVQRIFLWEFQRFLLFGVLFSGFGHFPLTLRGSPWVPLPDWPPALSRRFQWLRLNFIGPPRIGSIGLWGIIRIGQSPMPPRKQPFGSGGGIIRLPRILIGGTRTTIQSNTASHQEHRRHKWIQKKLFVCFSSFQTARSKCQSQGGCLYKVSFCQNVLSWKYLIY